MARPNRFSVDRDLDPTVEYVPPIRYESELLICRRFTIGVRLCFVSASLTAKIVPKVISSLLGLESRVFNVQL